MLTRNEIEKYQNRIEELRAMGADKQADSLEDGLQTQRNLADPAKCDQLLNECLAITDPYERAVFRNRHVEELSVAVRRRQQEGGAS